MSRTLFFLIVMLWCHNLWAQAGSRSFTDKNYISIGNEFTHFDKDFKPWNTSTIETKLNHNTWVFLSRINIANRFEKLGISVEQDIYKKFESKNYMFVNGSYSPSSIYYKYRLAAEYFNSFGKVWEHSIGGKFMQFRDSLYVAIITMSLSKYTGRFLTILRTNIGYENSSSSSTLNFSLQQRYYHSDNVYTALFTGYGYNPNVVLFNINRGLITSRNTTFNIGLKTFRQISQHWLMEIQAEYQWFDFGTSNRNLYTYSIKLFYSW